MSRIYFVDG
jgi:hypothetical protein